MKKILIASLFVTLLAFHFGCGNAKSHGGGGDGNQPNPPPPVTVDLVFEATPDGIGDYVWCEGPNLAWSRFEFNVNHLATIRNARPGDYTCNIEEDDGDWAVYSATAQSYPALANGYTLTEANIQDNGVGGGNWTFTLHSNGVVTVLGGVLPDTLVFEATPDGPGDYVWCEGPNLDWSRFEFNANHRAVIENADPGDYTCNIEEDDGDWAVYSATAQSYSALANGYTLTEANIFTQEDGNGFGWQFTLHDDGSITAIGSIPGDCGTEVASVNLEVELKNYSNFNFTPSLRFGDRTGNNWVPHVMTRISDNRYRVTLNAVPTGDTYTINFLNPNTGTLLITHSSGVADYVVKVNGVQLRELLGDDLRLDLDACANVETPIFDLTFVFDPTASGLSDVKLAFGQDVFTPYVMNVGGDGNWSVTLIGVEPGRYEANIYYWTTSQQVAVWPDQIQGTITINNLVMTTNDEIIYAELVPLPDPTNTQLIFVEANLCFDVWADGTIHGVNLRNGDIIIIIPVDP